MRTNDKDTLHTVAVVALGIGIGALVAAGLVAFGLQIILLLSLGV